MSGDLLYIDVDYMEYINNIFKENVRITQEILTLINNLPFKTLRQLLKRLLRTKVMTRAIAKMALKTI